MRRFGDSVCKRRRTTDTKSSCAACRHPASERKYSEGNSYPSAHILADSSSKSFLDASDASCSSADIALDDVLSIAVKMAFAHPISGGTVQSSVERVMVSIGEGYDGRICFSFRISLITGIVGRGSIFATIDGVFSGMHDGVCTR